MTRKSLYLVSAGLTAAVLFVSGCGSAMKESGGDQTTTSETKSQILSVVTCNCHTQQGLWLEGRHSNINGSPSPSASNDVDCYPCHTGTDRLGDGISPDRRYLVSCGTCHAGDQAGGQHLWLNPRPEVETCGICHDEMNEDHLYYHPEAANIASRFESSRHYTATVRFDEEKCPKCHTDEGARAYRNVNSREGLELVPALHEASPVQCRTCHNAHQVGRLLKDAVMSGEVTVESDQYATCTNCHGRADAVISTDPDEVGVLYHENRYFRIIADSHNDDPATLGTIEGYVLDPANGHVCLDCHDTHSVAEISDFKGTATINEQWAKSGHAGKIGYAKMDEALAASNDGYYRTTVQTMRIQAAGATEETGPAWVHYPWTDVSRSSCARCHTSTGARAFLDDPEGYTPSVLYDSEGKFPHIAKSATGSTITALQKELLYCWVCHANNSGAVRDPGPVTANYNYSSGGVVVLANSFTYPDVKNSNVCMACHTGRENGDTIANLASAGGVTINFTNLSFINSHYLTAGGTLFGVTGYEYAATYANYSFYEHDRIGLMGTTAAATGGTTSGPCAGCHMTSAASHLFLPVEADEDTGEVTTITGTVCAACHTGPSSLSAEELNEEAEGMHAILAALEEALADTTLKPAFYYTNSNPYFFKVPGSTASGDAVKNWNNTGDADTTGNTSGKNNMGAAFNLNLLRHDPGAYAHNGLYARLLVFDSIDWLDDNVMDGVVNLSAFSTSAAAAAFFGTSETASVPRPPID